MDRQTEDGGDSVFFVVSGCPDGFPLEASKAPVSFSPEMVFFKGSLLVLAWGEITNRTYGRREGIGTYAVHSAVSRACWQDCGRQAPQDCGTNGRPTGYSLSQAVFPLGGSQRPFMWHGRYYHTWFFLSSRDKLEDLGLFPCDVLPQVEQP